jgi:hypothetical protein
MFHRHIVSVILVLGFASFAFVPPAHATVVNVTCGANGPDTRTFPCQAYSHSGASISWITPTSLLTITAGPDYDPGGGLTPATSHITYQCINDSSALYPHWDPISGRYYQTSKSILVQAGTVYRGAYSVSNQEPVYCQGLPPDYTVGDPVPTDIYVWVEISNTLCFLAYSYGDGSWCGGVFFPPLWSW